VKSFKKCCICSAVQIDDDMLWDGSEEDRNVRSGCEENEDTDCAVIIITKERENLTCFVY